MLRANKRMVSQFVIPSKSYFGGSTPYVFTEQGVAMLFAVLIRWQGSLSFGCEFERFGQEMVCFFKNGGIGFVGEN